MDTADLLFIAAEPREFDGAVKFWSDVRPLKLPVYWSRAATWKSNRVVAIANGAGQARAAGAVKAVPYQKLCNIGFCGALDAKLQIGDIVVGDAWLQPKTKRRHTVGLLASLDHVAQSREEKQQLRATGAVAVEMEASAFRYLPCYCIKSVSDLAEETFANDLNAALQPNGRFSIPTLLMNACARPIVRFSELKRLQTRSRIASDTLGEFLDSCEF